MIYILSLILIAAVFLYYRKTVPEIEPLKRYTLILLRSAAAVVILIYLLNPILRYVQRTMFDPEVLVLEDRSLSMRQPVEGSEKSSFFQSARDAAEEGYENAGFKIAERSFAGGLIERPDTLVVQSTRLQPALEELAKKQLLRHVNRILLISDGWLQDENLDFVRKLGIPVDVIVPDIEERQFDLEITNVVTNRNTFAGEDTPVAVEAAAREFGGDAQLTLLIDRKPVARKIVSFESQSYAETMFEHTFQREGLHLVEVSIEPAGDAPTEPNTGNNRKSTGISVSSKKKDILVVTDHIGWDTRFLKDALKLDRNWELDILRGQKGVLYRDQTRLNNQEIGKLSFHLLVVINHGDLRLPAPFVAQIGQAVQSGRGLWVMGYPILEELLPARASNIRKSFEGGILFTDEAQRYETFSSRDATAIPPVDYLYVNPVADARQLAIIGNEQRSPAITFHPYGQGKVLYFSFLNLWKWQMWEDENPYRLFASDIVSWLTAQAKDRFHAFAEKQVVSLGETVDIRLYALDETMRHQGNLNPSIRISDENGQTLYEDYLKSDNQGYRTDFSPDTPGKYTFVVQDDRTTQKSEGVFQVIAGTAESSDRGINEPLLRYLARETNGKVITESFDPGKSSPIEIQTFREIALYRKYWLLALFLVCYGLELLLRKRFGLL